jgi:hypothetical protein
VATKIKKNEKSEVKTVVKKIMPYPIEAELIGETAKIPLSVIYLSEKGFIAQVKSGIPRVGASILSQLVIPVSLHQVKSEVKIFKTFDRTIVDHKHKMIQRMVEALYIHLSEDDRKSIAAFVKAIGQK